MSAPEKAEKASFHDVSTADVAAACGVTTVAVNTWRSKIDAATGIWWDAAGEKRAQGGGGGKVIHWDLPRVVQWRLEREVSEALNRAKVDAPPPTLLEQEQLRKIRIHNDESEGRLVDRAELDRQWAKAGGDLRQRLETLGRRHGMVVANDLARVMKDLDRAIHGLMGKAP